MALSAAVLRPFLGKPVTLFAEVYDEGEESFGYAGEGVLSSIKGNALLLADKEGGEVCCIVDARNLAAVALSDEEPALSALEGGKMATVSPLRATPDERPAG